MKDAPKTSNHFSTEMELEQRHDASKDTPVLPVVMSECKIMKNLIIVCLGFIFLFSSYQALANLQSTMNMEGNLGVVSQSVIYATLIVSSLFLPKLVIRKFGCKLTLVFSILTYAPYIAANFYPHMGTFVPTAVLLGLGAAPLWSAKCTYINEISVLYATHGKDTADVVTSRFFGIFFMLFQSTQVWGNLASFYVLKPSSPPSFLGHDSDVNDTVKMFLGSPEAPPHLNGTCGVNFCSGINENLMPPTEGKRYMLTGIFVASVILAAMVVAVFLDPLKKTKTYDLDEESILSKAIATLKHLRKTDQMLLVPLTIFSGIEQAFILGDYTKAYVACSWGLHNVGLVFVCFGVVNAALSFVAGRLVKHVSRMTLMLAGAIGNIGTCVALFLWQPDGERPVYFFLIIGIWGISDAVWQTQINALYGVLFRSEEEAAFANYRLWESMGFSIAFGYNSFLCIAAKIYILLVFLIVGMAGYIAVEVRTFLKKKEFQVTGSS